MTESLISHGIRILSVVAVIVTIGYPWFWIKRAWLRKQGLEEADARSRSSLSARKASLITAFIYMVGMVSVARLF
jgi:hypothetical protein